MVKYNKDLKIRAVNLAKKIGGYKTGKELGIPARTIYDWLKADRQGILCAEEKDEKDEQGKMPNCRECKATENLGKELCRLGEENERLEKDNEFLRKAVVFFASRRQGTLKDISEGKNDGLDKAVL